MPQAQTSVDAAARVLADARTRHIKIANLPESCRPQDIDTALAIQKRTLEMLADPIGGWKCGLQAKPGMIMLAPVPASALYTKSPVAMIGTPGKIEPEIAFVLARDIPPRAAEYTREEILAAVGDIRFVLELIGARFLNTADVTYHELLADCYNNYGLFLGPSIPNALDGPVEALHVKISGPDGAIVDREGKHPSGHPMNSFSWLVNYLSSRGETLKAGQVITTGSYAGIVDVPTGVPLRIELGNLGSIDVEVATGSR
jgi:2-keto-4-pentenoate hydratase